MSVELYQVGGSVRDELMGVEPHDFDFTAIANSWDELILWLDEQGFKRFVTTPEHYTVRAHFPRGFTFAGQDLSRLTADVVMARKEGPYTDGRRPDWVKPGWLSDDIFRRDFTVNAIAKDAYGGIIDLAGGVVDIESMTLRAVGSAEDRIREDALRAVRATRFEITKGFSVDEDIYDVLWSDWLPDLIGKVSVDRRREELTKCFKHDTVRTMYKLAALPTPYVKALFSNNLWVEPTNKGR